jgi:hypothetical protein
VTENVSKAYENYAIFDMLSGYLRSGNFQLKLSLR